MAVVISTSLGPVELAEMYEGWRGGIDVNRGPYFEKWYCAPAWAVAFASCNALMGVGPDPARHACPESPNCFCVAAELVPRGEQDLRLAGRPSWNLPVIRAIYAVPTWEELAAQDPGAENSFPSPDGSPYLFMEQSIDFDTEVIKLPGRAYKFLSDNTVVDVPVARTIAVANFVLVKALADDAPLRERHDIPEHAERRDVPRPAEGPGQVPPLPDPPPDANRRLAEPGGRADLPVASVRPQHAPPARLEHVRDDRGPLGEHALPVREPRRTPELSRPKHGRKNWLEPPKKGASVLQWAEAVWEALARVVNQGPEVASPLAKKDGVVFLAQDYQLYPAKATAAIPARSGTAWGSGAGELLLG